MIEEVKSLVDQYLNWLKDKTQLRQINGWVEITTPFLDRHNDYIQIYAKRENDGYLLTDDGYTITDLEQSGCKLDSKKRQNLLKMTLNGFGVRIRNGELQVHATRENFALRKHNLVQAILAVNDMFYLAVPVVQNLFYEDVVSWLEQLEIRYIPKVKFTGKSGYDHLFDFVIPKSNKQPERILKAINDPNRTTAQVFAFAWIDTKEVRPPNARAYALLNDSQKKVPSAVIDALQRYEVNPILWTKREEVIEELAT